MELLQQNNVTTSFVDKKISQLFSDVSYPGFNINEIYNQLVENNNEPLKRSYGKIKNERYLKNISSAVEELYTIVDEMKNQESVDLYQLLRISLKLKENLKQTYKITNGDFSSAALMIYDSIRKRKIEEFSLEQLETLIIVCTYLYTQRIDENIVNKIDEALLDADLDWVMCDE